MSESNPVRVMHFIHSLKAGGAERQLGYLVQSSDPAKLTHAVCCFNDEGRAELYSRAEIFKLDRRHKYDFKFREIYQLLKSWNPEIVHNWLPNVLVNSFFPARWYRKAIYVSSYRSAVKLNSPQRAFQALVYLFSDRLISITAEVGLFFPFRQIFRLKKGSFIPIGIPVDRIARAEPGLPDGLQTDPDQKLLLFVGRLSPEKNIPLLLQAMQGLSRGNRDMKLLICGEGRERERLAKTACDLGLEDQVDFLGYREDIYSIMKACDLLVFPSLREGMGNVLFEALAAGLPAIASNIPSLAYWFGNQEIVSLFDPSSRDELSTCIRRELDRPEDQRAQRRDDGLRLVRGLDISEMVRKSTEFYLGLNNQAEGI